jgi:hypothetical protein
LFKKLFKRNPSTLESVGMSVGAGVLAVAAVGLVSKLLGSSDTSQGVGVIGRPRDPGYPFQKQDIRASAYTKKRRQEHRAKLMAERPPKRPFRRRMEKRGFHGGPAYGGVRRRKVFMEAKTDDEILQLRRKLKEARAQVRAEKREQLRQRQRARAPKVLVIK